jgi:hypothetical protein
LGGILGDFGDKPMTYKGHNIRVSHKGYYVFTGGPNHLKFLHRVIWEEHYSPIPEGYDIHHKDEDKLNNDLDNLKCMIHGNHTKLHQIGKLVSGETRKKMSAVKKGVYIGEKNHRYGKSPSIETRKKISEAQSGEKHHMYNKKHSAETKRKMSEAHLGEANPMYGKPGTMLGKKLSEETKRKISESQKLRLKRLKAVVRGERG